LCALSIRINQPMELACDFFELLGAKFPCLLAKVAGRVKGARQERVARHRIPPCFPLGLDPPPKRGLALGRSPIALRRKFTENLEILAVIPVDSLEIPGSANDVGIEWR